MENYNYNVYSKINENGFMNNTIMSSLKMKILEISTKNYCDIHSNNTLSYSS